MLLVIFLGTFAISLLAMWRVQATYAKYSQFSTASGYTGAEVAALILRAAGIHDVDIVEHDECLGDHYDPKHGRLVLSSQNYRTSSAAALGVAAHECSHAIQHQIADAPLHLRMAAVGVTNFASHIVTWLPLLGIFTGLLSTYAGLLIMALSWGVIMAFNLVTLPVEFDASRRAKRLLGRMGFIHPGAEATAAPGPRRRRVDLQYVAAFLTSLVYSLWHLLPLLTGRSSEE